MMVDRELKPCPFCSGEATLHAFYESSYYEGCYVECDYCGARTQDERLRSEAIADWNTRPERINLYERLELVNEARKQAVLDFVEKLREYSCFYDLDNYHSFEAVEIDVIDDLAKEMLGEYYDG